LHQDAELVRGTMPIRLQVAHDAVASINGVMQLVARVAEALAHLVARPGDDVVDVRDGVRIANADHADITLADLARAFELDAKLFGATKPRARDTRGLLRDLLVAAFGHVERAPATCS
jgi:hypothetical protein